MTAWGVYKLNLTQLNPTKLTNYNYCATLGRAAGALAHSKGGSKPTRVIGGCKNLRHMDPGAELFFAKN